MSIRSLTLGSSLRAIGILTLVLLIIWYVHFQARNFIQGPSITLYGAYDMVQHEQSTSLTGVAKNIVKLTLNGREIHTNESGEFAQTLVLEHGYSIAELTAQDRFGRITSVERAYVYVPQLDEENGV